MLVGSTPLDDFLAGAGSNTESGERLQRIGVVLGATGTVVAIGLLIFVAGVWRGRDHDRRILIGCAAAMGLVAAIGGAVELAGIASILDIGWVDALGDDLGSSAMMRLVGGGLVAVGLLESFRPDPDSATWRLAPSAFFAFGGAVFALLSFGFDGHTTTEGPRVVHAVVNAVHVGAAGAWVGGLIALAIVGILGGLRGEGHRLLHRFSAIATVSIVAVGLAGIVMAVMVLDGFDELTGTDWGRLLLVKTALVAVAGIIGAYHHFRVVPELDRSGDEAVARRARTSLTVEAIVLLLVAIISGLLATASTV